MTLNYKAMLPASPIISPGAPAIEALVAAAEAMVAVVILLDCYIYLNKEIKW